MNFYRTKKLLQMVYPMISGNGTKNLFSMAFEIVGLEGGCYPSRPIKKA